jgi:general secretion pathway protein D
MVLSAAVAFGMSAWAQQKTTTTTANTMVSSPSPVLAQQSPTRKTKQKKVSRHNRHKAEKMFLAGAKAIQRNDPQDAEKDFLKAHELDPNNQRYPLSAEIARQYVVTQLAKQAKTEEEEGRADDAASAFEKVMRLDSQNPTVIEHLNALKADASAELPEVRATDNDVAAPIELAPRELRCSFHLNADEQDVIRHVLKAYGIRATVDQSVHSQVVRFDADDVNFTEAANMMTQATDTFVVPLDPLYVIVVADTKENRSKYERQAMETIYFPGLDAKELADMGKIARNIFGAQHDVVQANQGTMTLRVPASELLALNQTYAELLAGRSELQLEVHLYEVDKSKMTNVGVVLPTSATVFNVPSEVNSILANNASLVNQIIAEYPALAGNYVGILAALIASGALTGTVFNSPFAVFGGGLTETGVGLGSASANMLLNSSDVRSIDQIQLRVLDQEEATIRNGERYPVMMSSYSAGNSSALSYSTAGIAPQFQYEDLGLTLKVKPHIEEKNNVLLTLDLKLASLAGSTLNNLPILNNQEYTDVVSLHPGDSALVVSAISKQDSLEITGVPGLTDIPGFQDATNRQDTQDIMELAIVITPHIVRLVHIGTTGSMLLLPQH